MMESFAQVEEASPREIQQHLIDKWRFIDNVLVFSRLIFIVAPGDTIPGKLFTDKKERKLNMEGVVESYKTPEGVRIYSYVRLGEYYNKLAQELGKLKKEFWEKYNDLAIVVRDLPKYNYPVGLSQISTQRILLSKAPGMEIALRHELGHLVWPLLLQSTRDSIALLYQHMMREGGTLFKVLDEDQYFGFPKQVGQPYKNPGEMWASAWTIWEIRDKIDLSKLSPAEKQTFKILMEEIGRWKAPSQP
ncbi:MAG: hypothetical protein GXN92_03115 [Candidatus Micrarchaeota archaeon]|nr:hypothetical protein [Candidatus Micrarchaeota archaeon]